ncbi:MAG TPA: 16S rRNA (cytidine(1402)-2'-O)-methyltransferase [Terriglobales bacterium]
MHPRTVKDESHLRNKLQELFAAASEKELSPGLYIVATPIGNLEDITLRALRVLEQADLIACEDTRQTQKLLNHFGIHKQTVSYHEHNEVARTQELLAELKQGAKVALVSDAGMPGISDPGSVVIREAVQQGIPVVPVPGPSALITALVASGLDTASFRFFGFLPAKSGQRRTFLEQLKSAPETLVFYEAPHRVVETLQDIVAVMGSVRQVVIARELSKIHEEFLRGTAQEVLKQLEAREVKGEITLLIAGYTGDAAVEEKKSLSQRMTELMQEGADEKLALKNVAKEFGVSKSEAYREWQRRKR